MFDTLQRQKRVQQYTKGNKDKHTKRGWESSKKEKQRQNKLEYMENKDSRVCRLLSMRQYKYG